MTYVSIYVLLSMDIPLLTFPDYYIRGRKIDYSGVAARGMSCPTWRQKIIRKPEEH